MRWQQGRRSENVEDRRGQRRAGAGIRLGGGLGGIVILLLAFVLLGPEQAMNLLQQNGGGGVAVGPAPAETAPNPQEDQLVDFVRVVLGTTEDVWHDQF